MKKYLLLLLSILILNACEKKIEESKNPKINVSFLSNTEFFGHKVFIMLFSGNKDNPIFQAAGYLTLQPRQLNNLDLLQVNENILGSQIAHVTPAEYYIGAYLDMDNSTSNLNDLSTWMPNPGDYVMEVQSVEITEDATFTCQDFDKVAEPGKLTVNIHDANILQNNPVHYNIFKKGYYNQILSAGTITFPLVDHRFVAMEVNQSKEKVFDGGEYTLQVYCDLDNTQSDYSFGDFFHFNYGDILSEYDFRIDNDTILYFNEDYSRNGYARVKLELCGLDEYDGAKSYLTLYKKVGGNNVVIYATADVFYIYKLGCYTYMIHSVDEGPESKYYELGTDYYIKGIVDIDSSSYGEPIWDSIIANEGDLELIDYPASLLGDTTISISLDNFNVVE